MRVDLWTDPRSWDAFLGGMPGANHYHYWKWRNAIQATFRHEPYYLAATCAGEIRGVLPLFLIRSRLFGDRLVSMPFFSYGGVRAGTEEASAALLQAAEDLGRKLGVRNIELRQGTELNSDWHHADRKVTMIVRLRDRSEDLWKGLTSGLRNKIRSAEKHSLAPEWGGAPLVKDFYGVFAANMRNLGTPVYPISWFENLCGAESDIHILVLRDGSKPVASAFLVPTREGVELPWSASLPESRKKYSQVFLYWNMLQWATGCGLRQVDLGRCSPGGGTYEFKRHWGCDEVQLNWYYWVAPGASIPRLHADNPKFALAQRAWRHLPLRVANTIGPRIVRSIP